MSCLLTSRTAIPWSGSCVPPPRCLGTGNRFSVGEKRMTARPSRYWSRHAAEYIWTGADDGVCPYSICPISQLLQITQRGRFCTLDPPKQH